MTQRQHERMRHTRPMLSRAADERVIFTLPPLNLGLPRPPQARPQPSGQVYKSR